MIAVKGLLCVGRGFRRLGQAACLWVGLGAGLVLAGPAVAEQVERMFDAVVPVATQGVEDRDRALAAALETVLVRVSGVADVAKRRGVADLFKNPQRLVQQYRYELAPEQRQPTGDAPSADMPGDAVPAVRGMQLQVSFDARAVERGLQSAGLPVWGRDRPLSLLVLALDNGTERGLVGADVDPGLRKTLDDASQRRGVPLVLPLLDLQDQMLLNYDAVTGGDSGPVLQAADRYAADNVVVGRAVYANAQWQSRWTLYQQGQEFTWESTAASLNEVLGRGVDGLADALSRRLAPVMADAPAGGGAAAGGGGRVSLRVTGITSLDQFASVERYLSGLTTVSRVTSQQFDPAGVNFQLEVRGAVSYLQQAIAFGSVLVPDSAMQSDPGLAGQQTQVLYYRMGP